MRQIKSLAAALVTALLLAGVAGAETDSESVSADASVGEREVTVRAEKVAPGL
jgi:hypothetical protein